MKGYISSAIKAHFVRGAFYLGLLLVGTLPVLFPLKGSTKKSVVTHTGVVTTA
jgi:hypothetical protein